VKKAVQHGSNLQISQTIGIGTRGYMPFEQGLGEPKFASDIYAVGAIALQCLTGVRPSSLLDENTYQFTWRHLCQVSKPMDNLLSKMVELMPANRCANAEEAKKALDRLIAPVNQQPIQPKPTAQPVKPQASPFNSPSTTKINRPVKAVTHPLPVINSPKPSPLIKSPVRSVTTPSNNHPFIMIIIWGSLAGIVALSQLFKGIDRKPSELLPNQASSSTETVISSADTTGTVLSIYERTQLTPVKTALVMANSAVKGGDMIKCKKQFDKFQVIWPTVEPMLKAKAGISYQQIDTGINMVKTAMESTHPDKGKVMEGLTEAIK
jgi:serine/threonine protein kinase